MAKMLEAAGVDALNISVGNYSTETFWGSSDYPVAYIAKYAEDIKKKPAGPAPTIQIFLT